MAVAIAQTANPAGVAASGNIATYSAQSIGAEAVDRIVVLLVGTVLASSAPTAATIDFGQGPVAMTATAAAGNQGSLYVRAFWLPVQTGTTAEFKITFGSTNPTAVQNHVAIYRVTGATSTPAESVVNDTDADPITTPMLTIAANGGLLVVDCHATAATARTWAGTGGATEDIDESSGTGGFRFGTGVSTTAGSSTTTVSGANAEDATLAYLNFAPGVPAMRPYPPAGALALAGAVPTIAVSELRDLSPAAGSLSLSSAAPTVVISFNLIPAAASLALSGAAPALSTFVAGQYDETGETAAITLPGNSYTEVEFGLLLDYPNLSATDKLAFRVYANGAAINYDVTPEIAVPAVVPAASLSLTSAAPSLVVNFIRQPAAGSLTLSGTVSALLRTFQYLPDAGSLTFSADAPTAQINAAFEPAAGSLVFSAEAPTAVLFGTVDYNYVPGVGSLTLSGDAPEIAIPVSCIPDAAALTLSADAPAASVTTLLAPAAASLVLSGATPSLSQNLIKTPAAAALSLSAVAPASVQNEIRVPAAAALALSTEAATLDQLFNVYRDPAAANLALVGETPTRTVRAGIEPEPASLDLSADAPSISFGAIFRPASAVLALVAEPPIPCQDIILTVAPAALALSTAASSIGFSSAAESEWLVCTSITINPELAADLSAAAELQTLVELNASLDASLDMKEC